MTSEKTKLGKHGIQTGRRKVAAWRWIILRNTAILLTVILFGWLGVNLVHYISAENAEPTEGIVIHKYYTQGYYTGKMYMPDRWVIVYENEAGERGDVQVSESFWHHLDEGDWYVG